MMRLYRKLFLTMVAVVGFASLSACQTAKSTKTMSNSELVVELQVANVEKSRKAANELFARGTSVIPALLSLRGNKKPFAAASWLGRPTAAKLIFPAGLPGEPGSDVPIEVAALYLITAIYKGNLQFAQSPYLTDLNVPAE